MRRYWQDIAPQTLKDFDWSDWIGILPLGATEQHGPHLPFETDSLIASGIVKRIADGLPQNSKVTFLPVEEIGYSPEHLDYPGSKSLSYDEAIEKWIGIGERLNSHGIKKIILLNAHGGNSALVTIVTTELRLRFSMLAVATSWTRFGVPQGLIDRDEVAYGIHGGEIETSVMMALHPELVKSGMAENFNSLQEELANNNKYLRAYGKHGFGWKMQDLNPSGVVGNGAGASGDKGEKLLEHSVEGLMQLIKEVQQFDIGLLEKSDRLVQNGKQKP
ncbi:MAG: creatininase family protein [Rhizobiaceae bacterium]|nr:creatininase family protein [Rhizobiaceae bacterium]